MIAKVFFVGRHGVAVGHLYVNNWPSGYKVHYLLYGTVLRALNIKGWGVAVATFQLVVRGGRRSVI